MAELERFFEDREKEQFYNKDTEGAGIQFTVITYVDGEKVVLDFNELWAGTPSTCIKEEISIDAKKSNVLLLPNELDDLISNSENLRKLISIAREKAFLRKAYCKGEFGAKDLERFIDLKLQETLLYANKKEE